MPVYFLHLRKTNGSMVVDPEGEDLPDFPAAQEAALEVARELLADAILSRRDVSAEVIIAGAEGEHLGSVPIQTALPANFRYVRP